MSIRINCFIGGVQKAGTTSLFEILRRHPQLVAPSCKELHFFDDERRDWSTPDYSDIEQFYPFRKEGLRFEATPNYCFWPQSMARLQRYNPDARIILIFRDPFDRAWSHWCMQYARGWEGLSFSNAVQSEDVRMAQWPVNAPERRKFSYLGRGRYGTQLARAMALFPREQLLLITAEEFARDQAGLLARITSFLEIDDIGHVERIRAHQRPKIAYPALPNAGDRSFVYSVLREEMEALSRLTSSQICYPLAEATVI